MPKTVMASLICASILLAGVKSGNDMLHRWKRLICLMVVVILFVMGMRTSADAGQLEDGQAAYDQKDYGTALTLWWPLAEHGDAEAERLVGTIYRDGLGVDQDYDEAMIWFRRAADQGNAAALYNVGVMYRDGQGVTQDNAEALRWLKLSAGKGYAPAQDKVGTAYEYGLGVRQDYVQAYMWYSYAAARDAKYVRSRDILAGRLTPDQIAEATRQAAQLKPVNN